MTLTASDSIPRRHDLDALRAIAMLLGIVLHGAIAYVPMIGDGWPVHDSTSSHLYSVFLACIHGFRMPLFFLISGFFTAMLWRKRGLNALIRHRFKRIFLPLVIGFFTIVPVVWIASISTGIRSTLINQSSQNSLWQSIRDSEMETVGTYLDSDFNVNQLEPETGTNALTIASARGNSELARRLIDEGAAVNGRNRDGSTAIHWAILMGSTDVTKLLIENGADLEIRNRLGETPSDMIRIDGMRLLIAVGLSGMEMSGPPDRNAIASILQNQGISITARAPDEANSEFLRGVAVLMLTIFPIFHHLWFLWFLCWLVAAFAIYAWISSMASIRLPNWAVLSPARYLWLVPITMIPQWYMGTLYPNFGPDTSTGIFPSPTILAYYAIFFFFGALYFDRDDPRGQLGRWWVCTVPAALFVIFPIGLELTTGDFGFLGYRFVDSGWNRPLSVLVQVIYAWMMTFGLMGLFRALLSKESRTMRYISDSAYWMYLAHLPVIMVAQSVVQSWPIPAAVKLAFVSLSTSILLILSYQWLVRYTPIGTLLNGPRSRSTVSPPTSTA